MDLQRHFRRNRDFQIAFTGGEPTVNPHFIDFAIYLKDKRKEYDNLFNVKLSLTTNGAMSKKICQGVIDNFDHVTVSYHCEADESLKYQVLDRIMMFGKSNIGLNVNVMLHAEHFQECINVCNMLKDNNIKFIPRVIGDEPGSLSARSHQYTDEQKQWFKDYWKTDSQPIIGRPCCGGRSMQVTEGENVQVVKFLKNRQFENWHCSVNWFFLHLEQHTDKVYHHQTCQATFEGRGHIGTISEGDKIIDSLKEKLATKDMPIIVCPNTFCGCGLCTPKSNDRNYLIDLLDTNLDTSIFSKH
jgi:MoaA/NifB/PqqE/SkfB family radical SAM enzyme